MTSQQAHEERTQRRQRRERIVSSTERSMLVEAAAGTGKTTLLIDRILHGVRTGGVRLPQLVAITFTEKAAAELESRLRQGLARHLYAEDLPIEEAQRIEEALSEIDRASISTIHSFCAALLRERPVEAAVDPEFEVLDETQADLLKEQCWRAWLAEEVQRTEGPLVQALLAGAAVGSGPRGHAGLKGLADAVVQSPETLDPSLFDLARPETPPEELARGLRELAPQAAGFIAKNMKGGNDQSRLLQSCVENLQGTEAQDVASVRAEAVGLADLNIEKALKSFETESREEGRALFGRLAELAGELLSHLACDLFEWVGRFASRYRDEKRRRSVLDFQDLLLLAARMLRENKQVRRRLQRRFRAFFVDEFQDTDPLQAEVIAFLCESTEGPPADRLEEVALEEGKLFVVGDPKQSIYRFRRADVKVYEQFKGLFERIGSEGDSVWQVFENFRSSAPLIERLNAVFERVLTPPEQEGVYQAPHVPLVAQQQGQRPAEAALIALYPPPGLERSGLKLETARQLEARYLARLLRELVGGHLPPELGAPPAEKPLGYGSFACLFRALTDVGIYEEALEQYRIPYRVVGGRSFYEREEIAETLALLRAVDDPLDQISIVAALRSSYFGLSDEELFRYREEGGRWNYQLTEVRSGPAGEAMSRLSQWHGRRNAVPPQVLLREILDASKALEAFMLKPAGEQRAANVQKLLGQLRSLWNASRGTFRSIVDYLATLHERRETEEESSIVEPGDEFVSLMSIHKAKGLEFDAVVLPDLSRKFQGRPGPLLLDRPNRRIAVSAGRGIRSSAYDELAEQEEGNEVEEQKRLLYVAATRARRLLVLPLFWQKEGEVRDCMLSFLVQSDCFPQPGEVPYGEARDGVFYWDTSPWLQQVSVEPQPRPAIPAGEEATADELLAERRKWLEEHDRVVRRASTGLRIVLPSAFDVGAARAPAGTDAAEGEAGRRFGSLFHELMQRMPLRDAGGREEVESLASGLAAIAAAEMGMDDDAAREAARLAVEARENEEFRALLARAETIQQEVPFSVPLRALPLWDEEAEGFLEGSIDLLLIGPDGVAVVDYKTDRLDSAPPEDASGRYWPQLALYALAAEACGYVPSRPELVLFFVRAGLMYRRRLDEDLLGQMRPRLGDLLSAETP